MNRSVCEVFERCRGQQDRSFSHRPRHRDRNHAAGRIPRTRRRRPPTQQIRSKSRIVEFEDARGDAGSSIDQVSGDDSDLPLRQDRAARARRAGGTGEPERRQQDETARIEVDGAAEQRDLDAGDACARATRPWRKRSWREASALRDRGVRGSTARASAGYAYADDRVALPRATRSSPSDRRRLQCSETERPESSSGDSSSRCC